MKTEREQIEAIVEIFAKSQKRCRSINDVILQEHYADALIKAGYGDVSEYKVEIKRLKNANSELTDNLVFYKDKSYKLEKNVDKLKTEIEQEVKQVKIDIVKKIEMAQLCGVSMYYVIKDLKKEIGDEN